MTTQWSPSVPNIIKHTVNYLPTLITLAIFSLLLVFVIDHVDFLLFKWPVRGIYRAYNRSILRPRSGHKQTGRELDILRDAYYKYSKRGKPFAARAGFGGWFTVLPRESCREYRNLPLDQLGFVHFLEQTFHFGYHFAEHWKSHTDAINGLHRKEPLDKVHNFIVSETDDLLPSTLGKMEGSEWKNFDAAESAHSLLLLLSISWTFGPGFARDRDFVEKVGTHIVTLDSVVNILAQTPRMLHPLVWRFFPTCRAFRSNILDLKKRLAPELKRRVDILQSQVEVDGSVSLLTGTLEQLFKDGILHRERCPEEEKIESLSMMSLFNIFEVWGPTHLVLYAMLYRVMADPQYVDVLREEISNSLNSSAGQWHPDVFSRMPKLESFTREVLRLHGPIMFGATRGVMKPVKLESMNMTFPTGTTITLPAKFIHNDPDYYPDPTVFDGYRFYDPITNSSTRASTASDTFLAFGQRPGLCPGRIIGVRMLQIIFGKIIMNYDVQFTDKDQKFPQSQLNLGDEIVSPGAKGRIRRR